MEHSVNSQERGEQTKIFTLIKSELDKSQNEYEQQQNRVNHITQTLRQWNQSYPREAEALRAGSHVPHIINIFAILRKMHGRNSNENFQTAWYLWYQRNKQLFEQYHLSIYGVANIQLKQYIEQGQTSYDPQQIVEYYRNTNLLVSIEDFADKIGRAHWGISDSEAQHDRIDDTTLERIQMIKRTDPNPNVKKIYTYLNRLKDLAHITLATLFTFGKVLPTGQSFSEGMVTVKGAIPDDPKDHGIKYYGEDNKYYSYFEYLKENGIKHIKEEHLTEMWALWNFICIQKRRYKLPLTKETLSYSQFAYLAQQYKDLLIHMFESQGLPWIHVGTLGTSVYKLEHHRIAAALALGMQIDAISTTEETFS